MIIHIPRGPEIIQMHCSPIMQFCLLPGDQREPDQQPIWSLLIYMLLAETEALGITDEDLSQRFGLVPSPVGGPSDPDPSSSNSESRFQSIKLKLKGKFVASGR